MNLLVSTYICLPVGLRLLKSTKFKILGAKCALVSRSVVRSVGCSEARNEVAVRRGKSSRVLLKSTEWKNRVLECGEGEDGVGLKRVEIYGIFWLEIYDSLRRRPFGNLPPACLRGCPLASRFCARQRLYSGSCTHDLHSLLQALTTLNTGYSTPPLPRFTSVSCTYFGSSISGTLSWTFKSDQLQWIKIWPIILEFVQAFSFQHACTECVQFSSSHWFHAWISWILSIIYIFTRVLGFMMQWESLWYRARNRRLISILSI